MAEVITRAEARERDLTHYFTGKPCAHQHVELRFVKNGACMACNRDQAAKRFRLEPDKYKADVAKSRAKHAVKIREKRLAAYRADPEKVLKKYKNWRAENKDKYEAARLNRFLSDPERHLEARRDWYRQNADQRRKYALEYQKNNPDKVRASLARRRSRKLAAEGKFTAEDIRSLFDAQDGKCAYCYVSLGKDYHVDHIVALSRGGSNWPDNLQLCCPTCNISKGAKDHAEFVRYLGRAV